MSGKGKPQKQLWIVVSANDINAFKTLQEAASEFTNLAEFVVNKGQIVCLKHSTETTSKGEESAKWEIVEESLEKIAQEFLKRQEGK